MSYRTMKERIELIKSSPEDSRWRGKEPYVVTDTHWTWIVMASAPHHAINHVLAKCDDASHELSAAPLRRVLKLEEHEILQTEGLDPIE